MSQYLLRFWGRDAEEFFESNKSEVADHAMERGGAYCFWFSSVDERTAMLARLDSVPGGCIVSALHSGPDVHKETVAEMTLRYKGKEYACKYGFGYGYCAEDAEYYLQLGNGSCDCNRCHYIQEVDADFPEIDKCGDEIELVDLVIDGGDTTRDRRPDQPPPVVIEFTGSFNLESKNRRVSWVGYIK